MSKPLYGEPIAKTPVYRRRVIDEQLDMLLSKFGAVLIKGPKWSGKTTTAEQHSKSAIYFQNPDSRKTYAELAEIKPSLLLEGDNPRLIDEWQTFPIIWDSIRHSVDRRKEEGLYILTGSNLYETKGVLHSGVGRIARLTMRTMSLWESGESSGEAELSKLFDGPGEIFGTSPLSYEDLPRVIVRGGWPKAVETGDDGQIAAEYCEAVLDSELFIDGKKRNRSKLEKLMKSLSRNVATGASNRRLLLDITDYDELPDNAEDSDEVWAEESFGKSKEPPMGIDTLRRYLEALDGICLTENMPAWLPKLRSETTIRTSETRYVSDPSVAAYFLDANSGDLVKDPETLGPLFENLVIRDLRIYAQALGGKVYHYRDKTGLEVDAVIHLRDGRWGAVEIKLNGSRADSAAKNLNRLKEKVDTEERNKLSFLAVVTGFGYAYTRKDGVHVLPIGCLKP